LANVRQWRSTGALHDGYTKLRMTSIDQRQMQRFARCGKDVPKVEIRVHVCVQADRLQDSRYTSVTTTGVVIAAGPRLPRIIRLQPG
jgi:hypothetical protein